MSCPDPGPSASFSAGKIGKSPRNGLRCGSASTSLQSEHGANRADEGERKRCFLT
jgi:hypothetical protein